MHVNVFFDYTCPYSYRVLPWIEAVIRGAGDVAVCWRTFSLKEAKHDQGSPSPFDDPEISSISVLALALAHAARKAEFDHYHRSVFEAMHRDDRRLDEGELLALAAAAGVDVPTFEQERPRWLAAVAQDHREGVVRYGVFGTPTLVFDEGEVVFVKLASTPQRGQELGLWESLRTVAQCFPELIEIKRPLKLPATIQR